MASMGAATACTGPTMGKAVLWRSVCYTALVSTLGAQQWVMLSGLSSTLALHLDVQASRIGPLAATYPLADVRQCELSQARQAVCHCTWVCRKQWRRVGWLLKPSRGCCSILGVRDSDSPNEEAEPAVLSTILVPGTVKDEKQQHRLQSTVCSSHACIYRCWPHTNCSCCDST